MPAFDGVSFLALAETAGQVPVTIAAPSLAVSSGAIAETLSGVSLDVAPLQIAQDALWTMPVADVAIRPRLVTKSHTGLNTRLGSVVSIKPLQKISSVNLQSTVGVVVTPQPLDFSSGGSLPAVAVSSAVTVGAHTVTLAAGDPAVVVGRAVGLLPLRVPVEPALAVAASHVISCGLLSAPQQLAHVAAGFGVKVSPTPIDVLSGVKSITTLVGVKVDTPVLVSSHALGASSSVVGINMPISRLTITNTISQSATNVGVRVLATSLSAESALLAGNAAVGSNIFLSSIENPYAFRASNLVGVAVAAKPLVLKAALGNSQDLVGVSVVLPAAGIEQQQLATKVYVGIQVALDSLGRDFSIGLPIIVFGTKLHATWLPVIDQFQGSRTAVATVLLLPRSQQVAVDMPKAFVEIWDGLPLVDRGLLPRRVDALQNSFVVASGQSARPIDSGQSGRVLDAPVRATPASSTFYRIQDAIFKRIIIDASFCLEADSQMSLTVDRQQRARRVDAVVNLRPIDMQVEHVTTYG